MTGIPLEFFGEPNVVTLPIGGNIPVGDLVGCIEKDIDLRIFGVIASGNRKSSAFQF